MGGGSNTLLKGGERGFVCVVAVSSAAAGCGYCSEPSLDQNKGCCSHTAGVWLLADPGRSTALCPGQARWRMELGGPAGKKKPTLFFLYKMSPVASSLPAAIPTGSLLDFVQRQCGEENQIKD